jgi:hypothetical protein
MTGGCPRSDGKAEVVVEVHGVKRLSLLGFGGRLLIVLSLRSYIQLPWHWVRRTRTQLECTGVSLATLISILFRRGRES